MSPNPNGGPHTPEGRAISSQNSLTYGLFAIRDFIRPDERETYDEFARSLEDQLAPKGILELNLADEIRRAMWRLRRCSQIEESFSGTNEDPMQLEASAKLQLSVDRARSQSHRLLHKSTAELRKLQTERQLRNESNDAGTDLSHLGLADTAFISKDLNRQIASDYHTDHLETRAKVDAIFTPPTQPGSFCKTPRNAQCPCGSSQKYKRCCGRSAPPMLKAA